MFKKVAIAVALLVAALLAFAATKPDSFRVERSVTIQAPPEEIFIILNDFHHWGEWSPWEKLDPAMTRSHSGAPSGRGAVYEWEGNSDVGKGRMEIVKSSPSSHLEIQLDFFTPFEAHNTAEFALAPAGDSTKVTWSMHGPNAYPSKVMQVFMDMDTMIGKDFESGLANLKAIAEK